MRASCSEAENGADVGVQPHLGAEMPQKWAAEAQEEWGRSRGGLLRYSVFKDLEP
jgi:hypothetical protein